MAFCWMKFLYKQASNVWMFAKQIQPVNGLLMTAMYPCVCFLKTVHSSKLTALHVLPVRGIAQMRREILVIIALRLS